MKTAKKVFVGIDLFKRETHSCQLFGGRPENVDNYYHEYRRALSLDAPCSSADCDGDTKQ